MVSSRFLIIALSFFYKSLTGQQLNHLISYTDGQMQGAATIDGLNFANQAIMSPDGKSVYLVSGVGNIGGSSDDNAIAVFSRNEVTGELNFLEVHFDNDDNGNPGTADGLLGCRHAVVSPDGKNVYTAGFSDAKIGIFSRNTSDGTLTFISSVAEGGGIDGLTGITHLVISTDGKRLYTAGFTDDAVVAFKRDPTTGLLTYITRREDGVGGVNGLDQIRSLILSPDDRFIYSAAENDDAIALFDTVGGLRFITTYVEGQLQGMNTIDGIAAVTDLEVSPDGLQLYAVCVNQDGVSGNGNDWIAIFDRNTSDGLLTWKERIAGFTICGIFGSNARNFIEVSQDGKRVFVTRNWANTGIALFNRDPSDGSLTFVNGFCEFDPDDIMMNLPAGMVTDPLGKHLYVAATASDATAVFTACGTVNSDGDALPDLCDNCPTLTNPNQVDSDWDNVGFGCDCDDSDSDDSHVTINGNPIAADIYRANFDITTSGSLTTGMTVFQALNFIEFVPEFTVPVNSTLDVVIGDCSN